MYCELMAEHEDAPGRAAHVARWHVVRQDQHAALCGHVLARDAETLSLAVLPGPAIGGLCPVCWASYRSLP